MMTTSVQIITFLYWGSFRLIKLFIFLNIDLIVFQFLNQIFIVHLMEIGHVEVPVHQIQYLCQILKQSLMKHILQMVIYSYIIFIIFICICSICLQMMISMLKTEKFLKTIINLLMM